MYLYYHTKKISIYLLKDEVTRLNNYLTHYKQYSTEDTFQDFIDLFKLLRSSDNKISNKKDLLAYLYCCNYSKPILKEFFNFIAKTHPSKNNHYYQNRLIKTFMKDIDQNIDQNIDKLFLYKQNHYLQEFNRKFDFIKHINSNNFIEEYLEEYTKFIFDPQNHMSLSPQNINTTPATHFISSYTESILKVNENEKIFEILNTINFNSYFKILHTIRYLSLHYSRNIIELESLLRQHDNYIKKDISNFSYLEYSIFRYYYHYYSIHNYVNILEKLLSFYEENTLNLEILNHNFTSFSDTMINNIYNDKGLSLPLDNKQHLFLYHNDSNIKYRNIEIQHIVLFQDFFLCTTSHLNKMLTMQNSHFKEYFKTNLLKSIFSTNILGETDETQNFSTTEELTFFIKNLKKLKNRDIKKYLEKTNLSKLKELSSKYSKLDK